MPKAKTFEEILQACVEAVIAEDEDKAKTAMMALGIHFFGTFERAAGALERIAASLERHEPI